MRSGAAAVESALVLPPFLLIVIGFIEFAQVGMVTQVLNRAAREGCRVAVIGEKTLDDVQAAVDASLLGTGISVEGVTPSPSNWETAPKGSPVTIRLSVPVREISWLAEPLHFGEATLRASATLSSERP